MNRREAIQRVAMIIGGSVIGANLFLEGCTKPASKDVAILFEKESTNLLGDLAEAILPKTSTPGAKEAGVGDFIPVMIRDCYDPVDQKAFVEGLSKVDERAKKEFGKKFQELSKEEQLEFVNNFDKESKEYQKERNEKQSAAAEGSEPLPNHFFHMLKQLTLTGFFTSEVGMTQALRYEKVPGRFDGNYPYKKGDRAFA
ncbi:gluconate 2-dehydrogenase subunit 3 family protein [Sphingobacterium sp. UT-1RO-CII-1]|uniref:gluconate 2-dehydrogenase subunit 3 family protein n=1 Tax=Sphingobacterium sp. UT-1RO-CII-1 TaxID=2995225 RepID=UPI00227A5F46|nr:gluconate 2-dehydrogenase subunit 3 family protein [Sphingobacterium sp. UT-1RO-CII-1]MCY4780460.1 gluconate 2-dehydrogenase subunit 3 family protein [Sphingobacterium sp. UT-1RO-CII-1]